MKKYFSKIKKTFASFQIGLFLFVMPVSATYQMKDFGFGSGGTSGATSGTYSMQAITGEDTAGKLTGATYNIGPGLAYENQAGVPGAPTFTNPNNYYNKLKLVINTGGNPSDTKYAIAISSDNFVTTNYVQNDNTIGVVLGAEDRQTYATWGGAGGVLIIGLTANTTYKVKVDAMQGKLTETEYSATATAATISPTLSFGVTTNAHPSPPFSIDFGSMIPGSINTSPDQVNVTFSTNANTGGNVYVYGTNAGLYSATASYKINSMTTADLSGQTEGCGLQVISGGTLTAVAPYNGTINAVGILDQNVRNVFSSASPIAGGAGSFLLKAKPSSIAPAASDYAEILTVIASASF